MEGMALNQRSQRSSRCPLQQHLALCVLAIWAAGAAAHDVRPSEHGLAYQKDPGPASPAMVSFFRGRPEVALPEARNVSDPAWKVVAPPVPQRRDQPNGVLLAAGVAFGIVGSALLAAAAVAYVVHARRSGSGLGPGWMFGSARRRSGPEVRLGAA